MTECWNSDPNKRPVATDIYNRIGKMNGYNCEIMKSSDIGPVSANDPGAIYRSRPLSSMIQSAMFTISTRSLRSQSITAEIDLFHCHQRNNNSLNVKRKFEDNQIDNGDKIFPDKIIKKTKLIENENNGKIFCIFAINAIYASF
ncbi:hypothetical protein RhiirC2_748966 [Rhizophagus irregularis]|uniref:Serine-threonine/tyrosine-protein kinase catalytic domain-containing protein n=1 Tax=Rhizophagus irregularis TaxID=588596 RepID=A0A2N1N5F4_9GLOM|nr:hypothetical protein RhiirC2_748966 [Rhizophagus irregularis]